MNGQTFQISIQADAKHAGQLEIVRVLLVSLSIDETSLVEIQRGQKTALSLFCPSRKLHSTLEKKLKQFRLKGVTITSDVLESEDWLTKWKKDFKPFRLTPKFEVVPMWLKETHRVPKGIEPIFIDTSMAFGTGLHATTRFMSLFVERCSGRFHSFCDIGTGTGILAIVAYKCGARQVAAFDISADAVAVAKENFAANNVPSVQISTDDIFKIKNRGQYEFVAANLITQDLVSAGHTIINMVKPGYFLAVSGISVKSYPQFREAFKQFPLRCLKVERGEGWTAVLFKRNMLT